MKINCEFQRRRFSKCIYFESSQTAQAIEFRKEFTKAFWSIGDLASLSFWKLTKIKIQVKHCQRFLIIYLLLQNTTRLLDFEMTSRITIHEGRLLVKKPFWNLCSLTKSKFQILFFFACDQTRVLCSRIKNVVKNVWKRPNQL